MVLLAYVETWLGGYAFIGLMYLVYRLFDILLIPVSLVT